MRDTKTQAEGKAGSLRGAWGRTQSLNPRTPGSRPEPRQMLNHWATQASQVLLFIFNYNFVGSAHRFWLSWHHRVCLCLIPWCPSLPGGWFQPESPSCCYKQGHSSLLLGFIFCTCWYLSVSFYIQHYHVFKSISYIYPTTELGNANWLSFWWDNALFSESLTGFLSPFYQVAPDCPVPLLSCYPLHFIRGFCFSPQLLIKHPL